MSKLGLIMTHFSISNCMRVFNQMKDLIVTIEPYMAHGLPQSYLLHAGTDLISVDLVKKHT